MGLVELEELVLRCRDERARRYVREAVSCYEAGAYRSCIVIAWIAVVFDLIDKFRELEMTGDGEARAVLEQFTRYQANHDVEGSLKFERGILDTAKDKFQLLTPLEHMDLKRLWDDRNRCAHPSMVSADETYDPPAELARCHLRNAVTYVIQHAPVQGKAALDRLLHEIESEYFPTSVEEAVTYLRSGPLARPRDSLTRNFVLLLVKGIVLDLEFRERHFWQYLTALSAVRRMHAPTVNRVLEQSLNDIARQVPDGRLQTVVALAAVVGDLWPYLSEDMHAKLRTYVRTMPDDDLALALTSTLCMTELSSQAAERLERVDRRQLVQLAAAAPRRAPPRLVQRAVDLLSTSQSYDAANAVATVLTQWARLLSSDQVAAVAEAICMNSEVSGAFDVQPLIAEICSISEQVRQRFRSILADHGCLERWDELTGGSPEAAEQDTNS